MHNYTLSAYNYNLPDDRIAQEPVHPADSAKLLVYRDSAVRDCSFIDLSDVLDSQSVLFFNDTKVMQSRVLVQDKKCLLKTGRSGVIMDGEIFVYQIHDDIYFEALVSDGKHYRPGSIIFWNNDIVLYSESFTQEGILFRLQGIDVLTFLQQYGQMPLPPYIQYSDDKAQRYQTCFAKYMGSAAAPTASLHFTPRLLSLLANAGHDIQYATLHVGLGTFKPVYREDIRQHDMHSEWAMIDPSLFVSIARYKKKGQKIVAVGTTMMRLLESLPYVRQKIQHLGYKMGGLDNDVVQFWDGITVDLEDRGYIKALDISEGKVFFQTKIFIYPGFNFYLVNRLITNFHLPKTSLLILVAACIGDNRKDIYQHAVDNHYRFYSFGDGMMIDVA